MIIRRAFMKDVPIIVELWKEFMENSNELLTKEKKTFELYPTKGKEIIDNFEKISSKKR